MPRKIKQGKRDKEYQRKDSILYRQYGKTSLRRRHLNGETKIWKHKPGNCLGEGCSKQREHQEQSAWYILGSARRLEKQTVWGWRGA